MGAILTVRGRNLSGDTVMLRFTHPRLASAIEQTILAANRTGTQVVTAIPTGPVADAAWPAGLYSVELVLNTAAGERTSNRIPLALAPDTSIVLPALSPARGAMSR